MKFKSFTIKNFKGIENLTINLNSEPNSNVYTLIGLNESGKTTILEAINFFGSQYRSSDTLTISDTREDAQYLIPINKIDNFNENIELCGELSIEEDEFDEIKNAIHKKLGIKITKTIKNFSLEQKYSFSNSIYSGTYNNYWSIDLIGKKGKERKEKKIAGEDWQACYKIFLERIPDVLYFPNFLFDFPDKIYLEPIEKEQKQNIFYRHLVQDILDSLENNLDIKEHITDRIKKNDTQARRHIESVLSKMSNKVTSVVFGAWDKIFNRKITNKEIKIIYDIEVVNNQLSVAYLQFMLRDGEEIYRISERSLGFRWFFVFLLLTQFRKDRARKTKDVLFLFDEPASNLHSTAQAQLLESFEKLPNVIYTTHSHHLVNPLWLENTYVVKNEGLNYDENDDQFYSKKTKVTILPYRTFAVRHPSQTNYFQPILDVLEYYPSRLENVPNILITEGKNDFYTLKYLQFALKLKNPINIMPGTGATKLDSIIQLYLAWGRNFIVLLDADKEGMQQQQRYIDLFGILVEKRIFTLKDINSSWKDRCCEDLFSQEDKIGIIQTKYPGENKFNKSIFNRAIQESMINRTTLNLSETATNNFLELFSFIGSKLPN